MVASLEIMVTIKKHMVIGGNLVVVGEDKLVTIGNKLVTGGIREKAIRYGR